MGDVIRGAFGTAVGGDLISIDGETGDPRLDFVQPSVTSKKGRDRLFGLSRFRVHSVRRAGNRLKPDQCATMVLNTILAIEVGSGSTFLRTASDAEPYLFEGTTRRLIRIHERSEEALAYLWDRYGLNSKDAFTPLIASNLKNFILTRGWIREGRRYAAYSPAQKTLWLSRYVGSAWRIDGSSIDSVWNGRDVFFVDDDGGRPWPDHRMPEIPAEVDPKNSPLLKLLTGINFVAESPSGMSPDDQRRALSAWIFSAAFPDLLPTKPLLLVEGAQGSGKSMAIKLIQHVIHGRPRPMILDKDRPDDFPIQLLRSMPIAHFDNVDSYIEWLPDKLAAYVTDGKFPKRKLYTDTGEVVIQPQSLVAVATKNPVSFRREDIPDRAVIIRLDRRDGFNDEATFFREIEARSPELYGEWLYWLNRIVARLREIGGAPKVHSALRMADFAGILDVVGSVLGWTDTEMQSTIDGMLREQLVFAGETDPVPDLIDRWLVDTKNHGRTIDASDLMNQLNAIAQALDKPRIRSITGLIQKMRSPHVQVLFDIRAVHKGTVWTYAIRRQDPS